MNRLIIATAVVSFASFGIARAADMPLPVKAPPMAPPAATWTGCYADAGAGYGFFNLQHEGTPDGGGLLFPTPTSNAAGEGWLGRFGGGCDVQLGSIGWSNIVVGAFGDYDVSSLQGQFIGAYSPFFGATFFGTAKESSAWAVGGRIGYLATPTLLAFFDGGYTGANFDQINLNTFFGGPTGTGFLAQTYQGWFIGGGTEYALNFLWPGLFWRNEYRYASYNQITAVGQTFGVGPNFINENMKPTVQTVTTSLVFRFNWFGH
jgi:outer membrane immunogenic protein